MTDNINCILLDDEQLAIDTLRWQIQEFCTGITIVATFSNPVEAKKYIDTHPVQLCFLDIDMPEMNGFQFLSQWSDAPPFDFIFTTAYSEYAIKAFKVSAINYLLKPIDEEDLVIAIEKYKTQKKSNSIQEQLKLLSSQIEEPHKYADRIALPTLEGIHLVEVENIIRLEADNNYTSIYLQNQESIIVSKTLKEVEKLLSPDRFFRIHQSHTIDLKKIKLYQRGRGGNVTLLDGSLLPVSKNKKEALLERLGV